MNSKRWTRNFIVIVLAFVVLAGGMVVILDPFFHYHSPLPGFHYELDSQRYQNDGITRHFPYNAMITGTSNSENFHTSGLDALYGTQSVKVPFPGASYHEVAQNLRTAFRTHPDLKLVVCSMDDSYLIEEPDAMHDELGEFPTYLTDRNPFNDIRYILNRDVLFNYCGVMLVQRLKGTPGGVTDFDSYSEDSDPAQFGRDAALFGLSAEDVSAPDEVQPLTDAELELVEKNVRRNIADIVKAHPDTEFCYFIPPVSIVRWGTNYHAGILERQIDAEEAAVRELLELPNLRIYNFYSNTELVTDLGRYKDPVHYNAETAGQLLAWMKEEEYQVTQDNVDEVFGLEREFYNHYNYTELFE